MSTTFATILSDGDSARVYPFTALRRERTTVAEAELDAAWAEAAEQDAYRARIVTDYYAARHAGDEYAAERLLTEAFQYDAAHPGENLGVELCGPQQVAA
ncbi:hypothetical protein [Streptomyces sp. DH37]|uniref:hypothetical protein n=1 Tax=Streptomyces sp. DH37 TaxID=3040122 RepID=UPI00244327B0|nr:hypothetical protein [Streptomyces sp. DH37]MDG9701690.1 hypothetical protein [Streptomyces sp. DH37]